MKNIVEIYCLADDLVKYIELGSKNVGRPASLSKSRIHNIGNYEARI